MFCFLFVFILRDLTLLLSLLIGDCVCISLNHIIISVNFYFLLNLERSLQILSDMQYSFYYEHTCAHNTCTLYRLIVMDLIVFFYILFFSSLSPCRKSGNLHY